MEEPQVLALNDCLRGNAQGMLINSSQVPKLTNDQYYGLLFLTTNILLVPPIICGNLLVIIAIYRYETLRTTTNFFILSLAVSDLLVGILAPYFSLVHYTDLGLNENKYHCIIGFCLMMLTCGTSMTNLVGISIERYISIRYPLEYVRWVTPFRVKIVIAVIWVYGFTFSGIPLFWNTWDQQETGQFMCRYAYVYPKGYLYCMMILTVTFLTVTAVLYFQVFRIAKKVQAEIQKTEKRFSQDAYRYRKQARIAKVLGMVLGCFYGCYLPFLTMTAVKVAIGKTEPLPVYIIAQICCVLVFSNSCFNFLIYACKSKDFKKGFRKMFGCSTTENEFHMDIESN